MTVEVDARTSRGYVHVLEQPSMENDYTVRIRIEDRQRGRFFYLLAASWTREGPDISWANIHKSRKLRQPHDSAWDDDGHRFKVTCGAIWVGSIDGTARLAIGGEEARVILGKASGDLEMTQGTAWPKGAYHPLVMATSAETRAKIVDLPTEKNDYTLVVDLEGHASEARIEIAW